MASEASDDVEAGCAARRDGADTRVGEADREVEGTGMLSEGSEGRV